MVDVDTVKKDLRQLRKVNHSIEALMAMRDRHEKRLAYLAKLPPSQETDEEKKKIEDLLQTIDIQKYIAKATALERKYMAAIEKLDPLDKKIIVDGYVNGKTYWKIGRDIGFTEIGIKKRMGKIFERLATMV